MEYEAITSMIATLGFPIVCCIGLAVFVWKFWTHYRDDMNKNMERLQQRCIEREKLLTAELEKSEDIIQKAVETLAFYETNIADIKNDVGEIKEIVLTKE